MLELTVDQLLVYHVKRLDRVVFVAEDFATETVTSFGFGTDGFLSVELAGLSLKAADDLVGIRGIC